MTGALLLWLDGVSRQAEAERGSSTVAPASQTTSISILRDDIEHTEPTETPAVRSVTEAKRHAPSSCTLRLEPPADPRDSA
jgi:hypothetical protein